MRKLIVSAVKREKSQPLRNCVASDPPLPSEFPCPCPPGGGGGGGGWGDDPSLRCWPPA